MKHMKTEKVAAVEAYERQVIENIKCDMCHKLIQVEKAYGVEEIEVSARIGKQYPEGGHGEKCEIDICLRCFREKLIPFIEADGNQIKWEDWEH